MFSHEDLRRIALATEYYSYWEPLNDGWRALLRDLRVHADPHQVRAGLSALLVRVPSLALEVMGPA